MRQHQWIAFDDFELTAVGWKFDNPSLAFGALQPGGKRNLSSLYIAYVSIVEHTNRYKQFRIWWKRRGTIVVPRRKREKTIRNNATKSHWIATRQRPLNLRRMTGHLYSELDVLHYWLSDSPWKIENKWRKWLDLLLPIFQPCRQQKACIPNKCTKILRAMYVRKSATHWSVGRTDCLKETKQTLINSISSPIHKQKFISRCRI